MSQNLISNQLQSLLDQFKHCQYALPVDEAFVDQFFLDRTTITETGRQFWEKDPKIRKLLTTSDRLRLQLQFGIHRFGQSTVEENFALSSIIKLLRPNRLLEIGIFRGQTSATVGRSLRENEIDGTLTAVDIDPAAIAIAEQALEKLSLRKYVNLLQGDSLVALAGLQELDFVFIDGDHKFDAVATEFVEAYNRLSPGGMIAMHDVGSPSWGFYQDPGLLFFLVLPDLLKENAVQSWLDSMCRESTMRMLSPFVETKYKYCESHVEGLELAKTTQRDIIEGAGGMGFVCKHEGAHRLDVRDVLARKPKGISAPLQTPARRASLIGRIFRRVANWIP